MKHIFASALLAFAVNLSNAQSDIPKNFDYGKAENGIYTNRFFQLTIEYPKEWVVQSDAQKEELSQAGKDLVTGDNETLKAVLDAAEVRSANLLSVFKHELGAPVDFNPSLIVIAENTKFAPGIKTGKDYLFHAKKLLEQTQLDYTIKDEFYLKKLGGKEFYVMEATLKTPAISVVQEYFTTVLNGFSLSFVISYADEEQKKELNAVLDKVKFKP